jgi:hypothetical protein
VDPAEKLRCNELNIAINEPLPKKSGNERRTRLDKNTVNSALIESGKYMLE